MSGLLETIKRDIRVNLISQFGLSRFYDNFKDGGAVTTLHNARNGVFANEEDERRFNKKFDRKDYEGSSELGNSLKQQRREKIDKKDVVMDEYSPNKQLKKDGSTHIDHIVAAKEIHENDEARLYMSDEERNAMAVNDKNMAVTNGSFNQSKGDKPMEEALNREKDGVKNSERFGIDEEVAMQKDKVAREHVSDTIDKAKLDYYIENLKKEGGKAALNQAKKQALGVMIYEFQDIFFTNVSNFIKTWNNYQSMKARIKNFISEVKKGVKRLKERTGEIVSRMIEGFISGGIAGFTSTIINTLINTIVTTSKKIAKILNDSIHSVIRAVKIILTPSSELSFGDKTRKATKIILTSLATSIAVILSEAIGHTIRVCHKFCV